MTFDLPGIFAAGLLTFFSPCILPIVPLYLSLFAGASVGEVRSGKRTGRLLADTAAFSLGLAAIFAGMGLAATTLGRLLVAHRTVLLQIGGLVIVLAGLKFLGLLRLPVLDSEARPWLRRVVPRANLAGSFALGAAFGLGWTPCIGPVLGAVLTYTATAAARPAMGGLYLAVYAAGLVAPLFAAALAAPLVLGWLDRVKPHLRRIEVATGALLVVVGLLVSTDHLGALTPSLPERATELAVEASGQPSPGAHGATCTGAAEAGGAPSCGLPSAASDAPVLTPITLPSGPVMVEVIGRSCPICRRMAPVVAAAEQDCAGRAVSVARVWVDDAPGLDLARRYGVRGVPTFLFLDADRREVARLVGEQPLDALVQSLQVLSGAQCRTFRSLPDSAPPAVAPGAARQDTAGG
jgi:cytochrome c-type biogenesis protein